jgi:hypothetical protein
MMNFLTNVTNESRHETGTGPVVEVPVVYYESLKRES